MNKRSIFNFEFKVIALMFIIFVIVLITGLTAYYRFSTILANISQSVRPDTRLVLSHSLKNDLTELSNIAKSHSLTEDFTYRKNYILIRNEIWEKMDEIKSLDSDFGESQMIVYLDSLIIDKLVVLDGIIYAEDPFRVQTALGKVVMNIDRTDADIEMDKPSVAVAENPEDAKKRKDELIALKQAGEKIEKLSREEEKLLRKKKRAEKRSKSEIIAELDSILNAQKQEAENVQRDITKVESFERDKKEAISQIYKDIEFVSTEELGIEKNIKLAQLKLISLDNELSLKIARLFDELELNENKKIAEATTNAAKENENTNVYFALFTGFVTVLLVVMAFIIVQYVKKNNLYKTALKRSKFETDQLVKTRERFMATITHEIRTPMHAISGFAAQLSKGKLSKEQGEYVQMIRTSSEHLTYLVNDVLDLSKLQNGKMFLNLEPFRLRDLAQEVVLFSKELVHDNRLQIGLLVDENIADCYLGDAHRLRQILLNLMSNAIKFTDRGAVELHLNLIQVNDNHHNICIRVEDSGIGMDKADLEHVFEEFKQAGERVDNKIAGTGLGLSITKRLVELHKGTIQITSTKGTGTSVEINLNLEVSSIPVAIKKKKIRTLPFKQILVVDDEAYNRKLLSSMFKEYDVTVHLAENGKEALQCIESHSIDLLLLDARMPVMDGFQTVQALKEMQSMQAQHLKIILLTAAGTELNALIEKVDGYVSKPFSEQTLLMEINRVFENETAMTTPNKELNSMRTTLNFEQLKSLSGSDMLFYTDMLETFQRSTENSMQTIQVAIKNEDLELVANEAHKIASPCRHIGAHQMHEFLKQLETSARVQKDTKAVKTILKQLKKEVEIVLSEVGQELQSIR